MDIMDLSESGKDLDETRRLLYMALFRQHTEKYELAGTIVNALIHHHCVEDDRAEVVGHVLSVIEDGSSESTRWIYGQIDRISGQLGD